MFKNSIGNVEAKEVVCTTHELKGENAGGRGCAGWRGIKGRGKWDNYNSIINKIYLKINKYKNVQSYQQIKKNKKENLGKPIPGRSRSLSKTHYIQRVVFYKIWSLTY